MEIIAPSGRRWRIRHRTRVERLRDGAATAAVFVISTVLWALSLGPFALFLFARL
jgi:hypothetical protein